MYEVYEQSAEYHLSQASEASDTRTAEVKLLSHIVTAKGSVGWNDEIGNKFVAEEAGQQQENVIQVCITVLEDMGETLDLLWSYEVIRAKLKQEYKGLLQ